jgi:NAD(P)-dependent dehydrogenase (short-subunit alcohol dehydrogenase family)
MEQSRTGLMAGRTVLVTGGSGGIGRATALGLAVIVLPRHRREPDRRGFDGAGHRGAGGRVRGDR